MDKAEEEIKLISRFAEANNLLMSVGKTPDGWDIEMCLYSAERGYPSSIMYIGYGSSNADVAKDLLKHIMLCKGWKSKDEIEVWCDLNCSSTCH